MKTKLLVIALRILNFVENKHDKRFYDIIKILSEEFEVHLLYVQSMFDIKENRKQIEELGVKVFSLNELKNQNKKKNIYGGYLKDLIEQEKYGIILFNTYYIAKHYLPYLEDYNNRAVVVIDAVKSQYLSSLSMAQRCKNIYQKNNMIKNAEISKTKEIAVYNHADLIIVDNEDSYKVLKEDVLKSEIKVISELNKGITDIFRSAKKKIAASKEDIKVDSAIVALNGGDSEQMDKIENIIKDTDCCKILGVNRVHENAGKTLVEKFNYTLKKISAQYSLILTDNIVLTKGFLGYLIFCIESHPKNAIVTPLSNIDLGDITNSEYLEEFVTKHYYANFGNWSDVKQIFGTCMLIRNEIIKKIGILDNRFSTIDYALFDYALKAFQSGYRILVVNESFVYYSRHIEEAPGKLEKDRKLLIDKWCNAGTQYLEAL